MKLVLLGEWDNPKDEARNQKRLKFGSEVMTPYREKLIEEKGIKVKMSGWADNTGHMIGWWEFETLEDFTKLWGDERMQQMWARWTYLVDNARIRILRPTFRIPQDLL